MVCIESLFNDKVLNQEMTN